MLRLREIRLPLDHDEEALRRAVLRRLDIDAAQLRSIAVHKRGYDARNRRAIVFSYTIDVATALDDVLLDRFHADPHLTVTPDMTYRHVAKAPSDIASRPIVAGSGPCGLFAALILAQMGFKPLILERGKPVRQRARDTFRFWRGGPLRPDSNVQFGEGGAGTFSDGKLHTGIRDPDNLVHNVLREFVQAGAPAEILFLSKPHIGTYGLVRVVENMRLGIESLGGEFRFSTRLDDLDIADGRLRAVRLDNGEKIACERLILAVGHSARDTFRMLHGRGVPLTAKPFSIGVRIEHPQSLIDERRLGSFAGHRALGAADYKLVHHCRGGRSVYSFCMCPGGEVVAAASEEGGVVTNGMSQYERGEPNANAGLVVGITPADYPDGPLAGIRLQCALEQAAFKLGGSSYHAPVQLLGDFLAGKASHGAGSVTPSYRPGVTFTDLTTLLPCFIITALREALPAFDRSIRGFAMADAVLTAVETRTSSPVRILRDNRFESEIKGLYPAGEGAGYAGGIISSAVDGIKAAEAVALSYVKTE
ncbi:hypothetical protein JW905_07605 [bacterium]|nr:hypothetical protein [candidate division CSSED10-310 bacterium]